MNEIKKDSLLSFSYGAYEDYSVTGVCKALKDFILEEVAKEHWYQCAEKKYAENPNDFFLWNYGVESSFITYLMENGYVVACDDERVYLGDDEFFDSYVWEEDFKKQKGIKNA